MHNPINSKLIQYWKLLFFIRTQKRFGLFGRFLDYFLRSTQMPLGEIFGKIYLIVINPVIIIIESAYLRLVFRKNHKALESRLIHYGGITCEEWENKVQFFVNYDTHANIAEWLSHLSIGLKSQIIKEADQYCRHIFDLFYSGPVQLDEKIDWHSDFKYGHRWNPSAYYKKIRYAPFPGGYDILFAWELNRCQHFIRLGQAYWITRDEKYAKEYINQIESWIDNNPWPWGVNWACAMEVAIRAVNWLWGYWLIRDSLSLSADFRVKLYHYIQIHGRHIRKNLENTVEIANNHYLSNLAGLIYLGILCPEFVEAREWCEFGVSELCNEMFKQVLPDGANFESSTAYHRLATELFLYPILLCMLNNIPVPVEVMTRLEKMLEFILFYTKPDGTVPLIGDTDNGKLLRLGVWEPPEKEWLDHRYLLAIGAIIFNRLDFAKAANDCWQEAFWLLGERAINYKKTVDMEATHYLSLHSMSFPDSGYFILRNEDEYIFIRAGRHFHGTHAHHDALSFELFVNNYSWIVDSGCYTYTYDYLARERFRSTFYHSTVTVDGENQNNARHIFWIEDETQPVIHKWDVGKDIEFLDASHYGYLRLPGGVIHRRCFTFDKKNRILTVFDSLDGKGSHVFSCRFPLGIGVSAYIDNDKEVTLKVDNHHLPMRFSYQWPIEIKVFAHELSMFYGHRVITHALDCTGEVELPCYFQTIFYLGGKVD